jgi:hypothetical protein
MIEDGVSRNALVRAYRYGDTLLKTALGELYGIQLFDLLICGPDHLLNLILAHRASSVGLKVAIYHPSAEQSPTFDPALDERMSYLHPSFASLIESQLGVHNLGSTLASVLEQLTLRLDEHTIGKDESLVYQLDGCDLIHDAYSAQSEWVRFWVEPANPQHTYQTIERFLFWDQETARRFDAGTDKLAKHVAEVDRVWFTGEPGHLMQGIDPSRQEFFGEAARPLSTFEYFKGQDRMKDILDALSAKP